MSIRTLLLATTLVASFAAPSVAQQAGGQMQMGGSSGQPMPSGGDLPEACRAAAQAGGQGQTMGNMQGQMSQGMQGMMGQMTEAQRGFHDAMMRMNSPMMTGMMARDADVAWACSMIPHHRAAVNMSRVVLRTGDNAEVKKMAEKVIRDQEMEIAELTTWIERNAAREGRNEATGSTTPRQ